MFPTSHKRKNWVDNKSSYCLSFSFELRNVRKFTKANIFWAKHYKNYVGKTRIMLGRENDIKDAVINAHLYQTKQTNATNRLISSSI